MVLSRKKFPWVTEKGLDERRMRVVKFGEWPITYEGVGYRLEEVYATSRGNIVLELSDPDGERVYATKFTLDDYGQEVTKCRKTRPPHLRPIGRMRGNFGEEDVGLHKVCPLNGKVLLVDAALPQDRAEFYDQHFVYYYFQKDGDDRLSRRQKTRKFTGRFGINGGPPRSDEVDWDAVDKFLRQVKGS